MRREIDEEDARERERRVTKAGGKTPRTTTPAEDKLWADFGLSSSFPTVEKIQRLFSVFQLDAEHIAELLEIPAKDVEKQITKLEERWRALGQELTDEDRVMARGRAIAELSSTLQQVERDYNKYTSDTNLLKAKITIQQKLNELKDIEGKRVQAEKEQENARTVLERTLAELPAERLEELLNELKEALLETSPLDVSAKPAPTVVESANTEVEGHDYDEAFDDE